MTMLEFKLQLVGVAVQRNKLKLELQRPRSLRDICLNAPVQPLSIVQTLIVVVSDDVAR